MHLLVSEAAASCGLAYRNMADGQQYDISRAAKRNIEDNARRRAVLRAEYIKQITDPHRHGSGEGGTVFDKGIQRFMSMRVAGYDSFKPTSRSAVTGLLCVVAPIVLYSWWLKSARDAQEEKYRTGQVSYADRKFKFI